MPTLWKERPGYDKAKLSAHLVIIHASELLLLDTTPASRAPAGIFPLEGRGLRTSHSQASTPSPITRHERMTLPLDNWSLSGVAVDATLNTLAHAEQLGAGALRQQAAHAQVAKTIGRNVPSSGAFFLALFRAVFRPLKRAVCILCKIM